MSNDHIRKLHKPLEIKGPEYRSGKGTCVLQDKITRAKQRVRLQIFGSATRGRVEKRGVLIPE